MTAKLVKEEAMRLPTRERAELAAALLDSLEQDTETLWIEEAERRYEAYRRGQIGAKDADVVVAGLREQLR